MSTFLIIGALALDRPIYLERPLESGGRFRARSLAGALDGRLGGGAANAGCALVAAGHAVQVASIVAEDADGRRVRTLAQAAGLDLGLTRQRPGSSARTLVLIDPEGERTIIGLDIDMSYALSPLPPPSDYHPLRPSGVLVRSAFKGAADLAAVAPGPVILHWPAPGYGGEADVVVTSAADLPEAVSMAPFRAVERQLGPRLSWVVVTHGASGAVCHGRTGELIVAKALQVVRRDTTGAGDIFAAGLLDALASGASMDQALSHACAWGSAAAGLDGSAPVDVPAGTFRAWSVEPLSKPT